MSSSPNSSPSDPSPSADSPSSDNSTTTAPPPSDSSAPPPTPGSSPPPPDSSTLPPTPNSSTPPATPTDFSPPPPPSNSTPPDSSPPPVPVTPPPTNSEPPSPLPNVIPPASSPPPTLPTSPPPPSIPPPVTPSTPNVPPPSIPSPVTPSTPNAPPLSIPPPRTPSTPSIPSPVTPSTPNVPPPSIPPPLTPSTPNVPPPVGISPPPPIVPSSPPPKNSSARPSPSPPPFKHEVPPPSPSSPVHTVPPPLPVPPIQSPAAPSADSSAPPVLAVVSPPDKTSPPSVPASSSPPPPQNNTLITPTADSSPNSTNNTRGFPAGGAIAIVFVGLLTLSLVVFSAWFVQRRKKKRNRLNQGYVVPSPFVSSPSSDSVLLRDQNAAIGSPRQSPYHSAHLNGSSSKTNLACNRDPGGMGHSKPWFTYEELFEATNGFSEDNLLGEGGFGYVYKGNLADGREVAVKQLKIGGRQGEREFKAEVDIISRIHHKHLVSIVGYCSTNFQRLLVYDYVPNNTLHYHIHGNVPVMTWVTRFKVASGAARGIAYLHEDCTPRIIHRDIKSANILLDNNFEAKVADFGLAKLALELEAHTHVSTRVMGTFGYMAPEYATTGKLTEKSDVFSFGVVLLELITGRKPVDSSQPLGDESLVGWARPLLTKALETEDFSNLVDPRLENNYVKIQMFRLIEAAAVCVRHSASKRPKMSQVVRALDSIGEMSDLSNGMKPGDSQIIDSKEQSAQIRMFQRMAFGSQEYGINFSGNSQSSWSGL